MKSLWSIALLIALPAWAPAVQISMDIQPRALTLGETVTLTLSVEGARQQGMPDLPPLDGLNLIGKSTGSSLSFDGHTQRHTVNHSFTLQPTRAGTIRVGPFSYPLEGKNFDLPAIELQVLSASISQTASGGAAEPLFATLVAEPTNVYHQQTFDLVLSIYSRGLNLDRQVAADFPSDGLKVAPLREVQGGREVIDNQIYDVRRWRGKATALTAGQFHLTPSLRVGLLVENRGRSRDPFFGGAFDDIFGRREIQPKDVPVRTLDLEVRPLPAEGKPSGFAGAVGQFEFDARAQPSELAAGEPVTVTMTLTGRGNIGMVAAPTLTVGDQIRAYDSKLVTDESDPDSASGRKIFEQVLIPRSGSVTGLPAATFAYFNPESGRYETIVRGPFPLLVRASSNEASRMVQAADPTATPAERVLLGADIGYLKPAPRTWTQTWQPAWLTSPVFLAAQAVPPMALGLLALAVRRRSALARDVRKARRVQAPRAARAALAEAEAALRAGQAVAYHDAIWRALTSYFAGRLNLEPGEATRDVVLARLQRAQAPAELVESMGSVFARCEEARFGAGGATVSAVEEQPRLEQLTRDLRAAEEVEL